MHTYTPRSPEKADLDNLPSVFDHPFNARSTSWPTRAGPAIGAVEALARGLAPRQRGQALLLLVDDVIFDDEFHWWSLNELTSGSGEWPSCLTL